MTPTAAPQSPALAAAVEGALFDARVARQKANGHIRRPHKVSAVPCPRCRWLDLEASAADAALEVAREKAGGR